MCFELTASLMCANYGNLEREVRELDEGGIDSFHIDIMDGRFVPNFAMSLNDMKYIAKATKKPLDVHLMIEHPNSNVQLFLDNLRKGDTVGKKIDKLLLLKEEMGFRAYWDGACSADKILKFAPKGIDGFVLETTLLFGKNRPYGDIIQEIHHYSDGL